MPAPSRFRTPEEAVDFTLERVGKRVVLGTPLGLGKANHLVNAFWQRAMDDPSLDLTIYTALTLSRPRWGSELERRLVEPLSERLFGDYPELAWVEPLRRGELPGNARVREFYLLPGFFLDSPAAQRGHTSSNYSHVVRDVLDAGLNVLAQLVGAEEVDGAPRLSLSCNPDLTLDLVPRMRRRELRGEPVAVLAQVNRQLPFFYGDAMLPEEAFDGILDGPQWQFDLPSVPNEGIDTTDYAIALRAAALVRDGGTIQLGIGALGDAVTWSLLLRHRENEAYRRALAALGGDGEQQAAFARVGGTGPFAEGLFAASEMLVDGFLELYKAGILRREVDDGTIAHSCFFLGPRSFYRRLRELPRQERQRFRMTSISWVNELHGDEEIKRRQRRHARFLNTGLKATLLGAVASDGLEDGRLISGVGGQYNFVAMAHALDDGRSVLMVRSAREADGEVTSNVVWSYGHATIPRHLRDLLVTEYGVADLRGRTDEEVAAAMVEVADSRFQEELVRAAKEAGKLPRGYRLPEHARGNLPERLEQALAPLRQQGHLPRLPFGTDLSEEEVVLVGALRALRRKVAAREVKAGDFEHLKEA
ncbi:MAG TPA: acetyl-CoA hydrolase/transferase C-terminal domain-containing protein, partial [Thermoanaerobaculia bacterium]|nr:acetyl-CoA hydrolase/transferase C-terminal domain-containing protein [Thermoanaerobaculia bacterium]